MSPDLIAACTGSTLADARTFAEPLTEAMERFEINATRRQAAFLATISIESAKLSKTEEGLYYKDPIRLASIFPRKFKSAAEAAPYTRNPEALGKILYEGDYWGRGLIQLSWLKNYKAAGDALGFDYVTNPELVAEPNHAALTAGWYWDHANCNASADIADMRGVTLRVNGPALMHLAERMTQYVKNVAVLT
jgi:putative chitinase